AARAAGEIPAATPAAVRYATSRADARSRMRRSRPRRLPRRGFPLLLAACCSPRTEDTSAQAATWAVSSPHHVPSRSAVAVQVLLGGLRDALLRQSLVDRLHRVEPRPGRDHTTEHVAFAARVRAHRTADAQRLRIAVRLEDHRRAGH